MGAQYVPTVSLSGHRESSEKAEGPKIDLTLVTPQDLARQLFELILVVVARHQPAQPLQLSVADVVIERPKNRDHGDWATSIALKISKPLGLNPRELAAELATELALVEGIAGVEVAGPGFINVRARPDHCRGRSRVRQR